MYAKEETICPKCGYQIRDPDDVVRMKSPILIVGQVETFELFQHTPDKDLPKHERRRHCGEWLLR